MLLKLIILVLIAVLIYFILRFSTKSILSRFAEVHGQKGIFSYEHIQLKNKGVNVILKDVSLFINPIAFFTNSIYLLWFDANSIAIEVSSIESSQTDKQSEKEEKELDLVRTTLFSLFGYSIIKRIHLSVENLILSLQIFDLSINARGLVLDYSNSEGSNLKFKYQIVTIKHEKLGTYSFAEAEYSLFIANHAIVKLFSFANSIFAFSMNISNLSFETKANTFIINPFSVFFELYPGKLNFDFPKFELTLVDKLPEASVTIDKIDLNFVYPIYQLNHFNCDNFYSEIFGLKIKCKSEKLFVIDKLSLLKQNLTSGSPIIVIDHLDVDYSTLDGLELFQIIPKLRGNKPYTPTRITFDFPDLNATIFCVNLSFKLTDAATLTATCYNATYKDKIVSFPDVIMNLNGVETFTAEKLQILSEDKTFLDIRADYFSFRDQNKVDIAEFINQFTYMISVLKPYISANVFDSETLPFPVRLAISQVKFAFEDCEINNTLLNVTKKLPEFMRDSIVLKHILDLKMEQCPLSEIQAKLAKEKVGDLIFHNYRKICENMKKYDKVAVKGSDILLEMDSRGFTGMVSKIHEFDPTIKEHYPDVGWETLEGFNFNLTVGDFDVYFVDLPEAVISMKKYQMKGPVVFGEVDVHGFVKVPFKVNGNDYFAHKTPADVKIYGDVELKSESARVFWGCSLAKLYDDFGDLIGRTFPDGVDPSPALMWWDKIRSMFRGKYSYACNSFVMELLGSSDPYDLKNVLSCNFDNLFIKFTEGKINLSTSNYTAVRCANGPTIISAPKFSMVVSFEWTQPNNDQHKHLTFPDVNKFDDPTNDTYKDVRSSGFDIDFDMHFEKSEYNSYISVDYAHLEWNIAPIMSMVMTPPLDETYKAKYGVKRKKPVKVMKLSQLNRSFTYRFNVDSLSLRVFDHFPAMEDKMINGTSFDVTFVAPKFSCRTEFPYGGEDFYDISMTSNNIYVNLTDLKDIVKKGEVKSSSICRIDNLNATYGVSSKISVDSIRVYMNQLNTKYVYELVKSIIHIRNKIVIAEAEKKAKQKMKEQIIQAFPEEKISQPNSVPTGAAQAGQGDLLKHLMRRNSSQRIATVFGQEGNEKQKTVKTNHTTDFTKTFYTVSIPLIEIVAESMRYETCLLNRIVDSQLVVKYTEDNSLMLINFTMNECQLLSNIGFGLSNDDRPQPIMTINACKLTYYQQKMEKDQWNDNIVDCKVERMTCEANTNHIASIKYLISEIMPEFPQSEKTLEMAADDYFSLKADFEVSQCTLSLKDQFKVDMTSVVISRIMGHFVNTLKGNSDNTITFDNIFANDTRKEAKFGGVVLMRWMDLTSDDSPHLRLQMRKGPPVGGVTVYNHVEMNIDPTVFNYDVEFVNAIRQMFEANIIAPETSLISKYIEESDTKLPQVLVEKGILPTIGDSWKDYLIAVKSSELTVMIKRAESNFLMRYFKVTDTKMNVSYKNEENSIISEISEFNGELHDIIYQDLTTTFSDLINKFIQTVTLDMIPQFLKHMIGLGKISRDKENDLQSWLNKDGSSSVLQKKKQLIFGKSNQK